MTSLDAQKLVVGTLLVMNIITVFLAHRRTVLLIDAMKQCRGKLPALFIEMIRGYSKLAFWELCLLLLNSLILVCCSAYLVFWAYSNT